MKQCTIRFGLSAPPRGSSFCGFRFFACGMSGRKDARLQKEVSFKLSSRFIPSSVGYPAGIGGSREDLGTCFPPPLAVEFSILYMHRWRKRGRNLGHI